MAQKKAMNEKKGAKGTTSDSDSFKVTIDEDDPDKVG